MGADSKGNAEARLGTTLCAKYRIDAVLGVGGMATVYAATHLRNANRVAVKILHRELSIDYARPIGDATRADLVVGRPRRSADPR